MDEKKSLELMALLDGTGEPGRREAVEAWLRSEPDAEALRQELDWVRQALQQHEPAAKVPETREFYWSQIRRRMDQATASEARPEPRRRFSDWLSWLAPVAGVAAVTMLISLHPWQGSGLNPGLNEASATTYTSEADGVTIHWID